MSDAPRRRSITLVLLLGALALIVFLSVEALNAGYGRRVAAENVIRDYAQFAAEELAGRIPQQLDYFGFGPAISQLMLLDRANAGTVPEVGALVASLPDPGNEAAKGIRAVVRLRPGDSVPTARGTPLSLVEAQWLVRVMRATLVTDSAAAQMAAVAIHPGDSDDLVVVYRQFTSPTAGGRTYYGVAIDRAALVARIEAAARQGPLLPRTLRRRTENVPIVTVRVRRADGLELMRFGAERGDSLLAGRAEVAAGYGGLVVETAVDRALVPRLIAGGIPAQNVALVSVVALLGVVLIAALYRQWRRELELARLRDDFVAGVSHELRTPLAQIRMFSETLLLGRVRSEGESRRSLEIVDREARRLTHLVENLLHFSRSERRITSVVPVAMPLAPVIREIVEMFLPLAAARQMTIVLELDESISASADADALRQILLNLLDNAVKYGPAGQAIRVGLLGEGGKSVIVVDDQGPGIPSADRLRIWERFTRLERDQRSAVAGTGIGLSIVHELVRLHGGETRVEDAPSGGARFAISLPPAGRT